VSAGPATVEGHHPRVVSVTAGGAGMFCGSCMRDNAVTAELHRMGVPIVLVPTFTPIRTDEEDVSRHRVFLGGINVYLEQRWPRLGRLPRLLRRGLDHPALLRALSRLALQTRREDDGALALSLLRGEDGPHASEMRDLVDFVAGQRPRIVSLTNLLIAGFLPLLRRRVDAAVTVTLQGDDIFLDSLPDRHRHRVLAEMRRLAQSVDAFVTFSEDYRQRMAELFEIPPERIRVVPLGLAGAGDFSEGVCHRDGSAPGRVGWLARICPEKGFHRLVDSFLLLREMSGTKDARLVVGGWLGAADRP